MSEKSEGKVQVGIGVMIFRDGKILLGKRKGSHAEGEYAFPGGGLEYMEFLEEGAVREVDEEAGIEIENIRFQFVTNTKEYKPKHYVHIGFVADWKSGEPQCLEPDKCEGWGWYDVDSLPAPLMSLTQLGIESYKNKKVYYQDGTWS